MPLGIPRGARCVQRFDDSRNSAIHITYRISLRSSSMREPRDPLLKVVSVITFTNNPYIDAFKSTIQKKCEGEGIHRTPQPREVEWVPTRCAQGCDGNCELFRRVHIASPIKKRPATSPNHFSNDPSAGSPTETLLRLLLPLNDQV